MNSTPPQDPDHSDRAAWANYWSSLPRESTGCLPGLPRPAAAALEARWSAYFRGLPPGARVLDLGTGVGAVPRFALGLRPDLRLVGVDYVEGLRLDLPGFDYLGGVTMEALPFADGEFDVVTSQFSIEYAGEQAITELLRVSKPDASLMVVAHHSQSVILEQNRRRLAALEELCEDNGLLDAAGRLLGRPGLSMQEGRQALTPIVARLQHRHPGQGIVADAAGFVMGLVGSPHAAQELSRVRHEMGMEQLRLRALNRAALDDAAAQSLAQALSRLEHPVQLAVVDLPDSALPLAWCLQGG